MKSKIQFFFCGSFCMEVYLFEYHKNPFGDKFKKKNSQVLKAALKQYQFLYPLLNTVAKT